MSQLQAFHDVRFPLDLAFGTTGGPTRQTEVITMASGREQRNARWANSRRRFHVGYGVKTLDDLQEVIEFFEARRGRLFGFRFRDPLDWKSCKSGGTRSPQDQELGTGDGTNALFPLIKHYGPTDNSYTRKIVKPVAQSVTLARDGEVVASGDYTLDGETGMIEFAPQAIPAFGEKISAGYEFDIPVRFDTDEISVNLAHFKAGDIPTIPIVELLP